MAGILQNRRNTLSSGSDSQSCFLPGLAHFHRRLFSRFVIHPPAAKRIALLTIVVVAAFGFESPLAIQAQTTGTILSLYSFTGSLNVGDGTDAAGGVIQGKDGNFYGLTTGPQSSVFQLTIAGAVPTLKTLYQFTDGTDGGYPIGELVQGANGNFYGTASNGGDANGDGTIFQISSAGAFTPLHAFDGINGSSPQAGLVLGKDGNFYGTTTLGGSEQFGTIFQITPTGGFKVLHSFAGGSDGAYPTAKLVQGTDGNFYGTTSGISYESTNSNGTVFKITPSGQFTSLYSFTGGNDGSSPGAGLVQGTDGAFYGTTPGVGGPGLATVFRVTSAGQLTPLYTFNGDTDNGSPMSALAEGADGNFYGVTLIGGAYQITSSGAATFFGAGLGDQFMGALFQGTDGNFYGTSSFGGSYGNGWIFRLSVSDAANTAVPQITSSLNATAQMGTAFNYAITASNSPTSYGASGLPATLSVNTATGLISGTPTENGTYSVIISATNANGSGSATLTLSVTSTHPPFFNGETAVGNGVYYLAFPNGNDFGYYSYLSDPSYIYQFDLGYEYVFDAADGQGGVYFYDFTDGVFLYTSPNFPYPYLYDFSLNTVVYYYQGTTNPRYFYNFLSNRIISYLHYKSPASAR